MQQTIYKSGVLNATDLTGLYGGLSPIRIKIDPAVQGTYQFNYVYLNFQSQTPQEGNRLTFYFSDGRKTINFIYVLPANMATWNKGDTDYLIEMVVNKTSDLNRLANIRRMDLAIDSVLSECVSENVGTQITITYNRFSNFIDNVVWTGASGVTIQTTPFQTTNSILQQGSNPRVKLYLFENNLTPALAGNVNDNGDLILTKVIDYNPDYENFFTLNGLNIQSYIDWVKYLELTWFNNQRTFYFIIALEAGEVEYEILKSSIFNISGSYGVNLRGYQNFDIQHNYSVNPNQATPASKLPFGSLLERDIAVDSSGNLILLVSTYLAGASSVNLTIRTTFLNRNGGLIRTINKIFTVNNPAVVMKIPLQAADIPDATATIQVTPYISSTQVGQSYIYNLKDRCKFQSEQLYIVDAYGFMQTFSLWGDKEEKSQWSNTLYQKSLPFETDNYSEVTKKLTQDNKTKVTLTSGYRKKDSQEVKFLFDNLKDATLAFDTDFYPVIIEGLEAADETQDMINMRITYSYANE